MTDSGESDIEIYCTKSVVNKGEQVINKMTFFYDDLDEVVHEVGFSDTHYNRSGKTKYSKCNVCGKEVEHSRARIEAHLSRCIRNEFYGCKLDKSQSESRRCKRLKRERIRKQTIREFQNAVATFFIDARVPFRCADLNSFKAMFEAASLLPGEDFSQVAGHLAVAL